MKVRLVTLGAIFLPAALCLACGGRSTLDLPSPVAHTSAPALDFGLASCGREGDPRTVTLTNDATALPLSWTAKIDGPYALHGPTSGQLLSHESATLTILPELPGTAEAAFPVPGTLQLLTNDPAHPTIEVPLTAVARGATLAFPSSVDFGDVPLWSTSPEVPLTVTNTGNLAADVAFTMSPGSSFAPWGASAHVEPGASGDALFKFAPTVWGMADATVAVQVNGPVCGAVPSSIPLAGRGTQGVVLTSPGILDFGLVDCGTVPKAKYVHIENQGDAPFTYKALLTVGKAFAAIPSVATLAPGEAIELAVIGYGVPSTSAITPDLFSDKLTITTTTPGDVAHVVAIHETARGAILTFPPAVVGTVRGLIDTVETRPFALANTGNVSVTVSASSAANVLSVPATVVPTGGLLVASTVEVRPNPARLGIDDAVSFSLVASGPICGTSSPTVQGVVRAYDSALDLDAGDYSSCIVGHTHRVYCSCTTTCASFGLPDYSYTALVPNVLADQVIVSGYGACFRRGNQLDCAVYYGPLTKFSVSLPPDWTGLWGGLGAFHGCVTSLSGTLRCLGINGYGEWGTGGYTPSGLATTLTDAMVGQTPISAYSGRGVGFALRNGDVVGAGTSGNLGLGNAQVSPGAVVLTPVAVDGLHDAVAVAAMDRATGGCAVRANGSVVCWGDGVAAATDRGGFTDAVAVVPSDFNRGCVLRSTGDLAEWQGASSVSVGGGLHLPVVKLRGRVAGFVPGTFAIEAGGEVSTIAVGYPPERLLGFEGP